MLASQEYDKAAWFAPSANLRISDLLGPSGNWVRGQLWVVRITGSGTPQQSLMRGAMSQLFDSYDAQYWSSPAAVCMQGIENQKEVWLRVGTIWFIVVA
jgi:hypothetical protein